MPNQTLSEDAQQTLAHFGIPTEPSLFSVAVQRYRYVQQQNETVFKHGGPLTHLSSSSSLSEAWHAYLVYMQLQFNREVCKTLDPWMDMLASEIHGSPSETLSVSSASLNPFLSPLHSPLPPTLHGSHLGFAPEQKIDIPPKDLALTLNDLSMVLEQFGEASWDSMNAVGASSSPHTPCCHSWHPPLLRLPEPDMIVRIVLHAVSLVSVLLRRLALRIAFQCVHHLSFLTSLLSRDLSHMAACGDRPHRGERMAFLGLFHAILEQLERSMRLEAPMHLTSAGSLSSPSRMGSSPADPWTSRQPFAPTPSSQFATPASNQEHRLYISPASAGSGTSNPAAQRHISRRAPVSKVPVGWWYRVLRCLDSEEPAVASPATSAPSKLADGGLPTVLGSSLTAAGALESAEAEKQLALQVALRGILLFPAETTALSIHYTLLRSVTIPGFFSLVQIRAIMRTVLRAFDDPEKRKYFLMQDIGVLFSPFQAMDDKADRKKAPGMPPPQASQAATEPSRPSEAFLARLHWAKLALVELLSSPIGLMWVASEASCIRAMVDTLYLPDYSAERKLAVLSLLSDVLCRLSPQRNVQPLGTWNAVEKVWVPPQPPPLSYPFASPCAPSAYAFSLTDFLQTIRPEHYFRNAQHMSAAEKPKEGGGGGGDSLSPTPPPAPDNGNVSERLVPASTLLRCCPVHKAMGYHSLDVTLGYFILLLQAHGLPLAIMGMMSQEPVVGVVMDTAFILLQDLFLLSDSVLSREASRASHSKLNVAVGKSTIVGGGYFLNEVNSRNLQLRPQYGTGPWFHLLQNRRHELQQRRSYMDSEMLLSPHLLCTAGNGATRQLSTRRTLARACTPHSTVTGTFGGVANGGWNASLTQLSHHPLGAIEEGWHAGAFAETTTSPAAATPGTAASNEIPQRTPAEVLSLVVQHAHQPLQWPTADLLCYLERGTLFSPSLLSASRSVAWRASEGEKRSWGDRVRSWLRKGSPSNQRYPTPATTARSGGEASAGIEIEYRAAVVLLRFYSPHRLCPVALRHYEAYHSSPAAASSGFPTGSIRRFFMSHPLTGTSSVPLRKPGVGWLSPGMPSEDEAPPGSTTSMGPIRGGFLFQPSAPSTPLNYFTCLDPEKASHELCRIGPALLSNLLSIGSEHLPGSLEPLFTLLYEETDVVPNFLVMIEDWWASSGERTGSDGEGAHSGEDSSSEEEHEGLFNAFPKCFWVSAQGHVLLQMLGLLISHSVGVDLLRQGGVLHSLAGFTERVRRSTAVPYNAVKSPSTEWIQQGFSEENRCDTALLSTIMPDTPTIRVQIYLFSTLVTLFFRGDLQSHHSIEASSEVKGLMQLALRVSSREVRLAVLRQVRGILSTDLNSSSLRWCLDLLLTALRDNDPEVVSLAFLTLLVSCDFSEDAVDILINLTPIALMESDFIEANEELLCRSRILYRMASLSSGLMFLQCYNWVEKELGRYEYTLNRLQEEDEEQYDERLAGCPTPRGEVRRGKSFALALHLHEACFYAHETHNLLPSSETEQKNGSFSQPLPSVAPANSPSSPPLPAISSFRLSSSPSHAMSAMYNGKPSIIHSYNEWGRMYAPVHIAAVLVQTHEGRLLLEQSSLWKESVRILMAQPLPPDVFAFHGSEEEEDTEEDDSDQKEGGDAEEGVNMIERGTGLLGQVLYSAYDLNVGARKGGAVGRSAALSTTAQTVAAEPNGMAATLANADPSVAREIAAAVKTEAPEGVSIPTSVASLKYGRRKLRWLRKGRLLASKDGGVGQMLSLTRGYAAPVPQYTLTCVGTVGSLREAIYCIAAAASGSVEGLRMILHTPTVGSSGESTVGGGNGAAPGSSHSTVPPAAVPSKQLSQIAETSGLLLRLTALARYASVLTIRHTAQQGLSMIARTAEGEEILHKVGCAASRNPEAYISASGAPYAAAFAFCRGSLQVNPLKRPVRVSAAYYMRGGGSVFSGPQGSDGKKGARAQLSKCVSRAGAGGSAGDGLLAPFYKSGEKDLNPTPLKALLHAGRLQGKVVARAMELLGSLPSSSTRTSVKESLLEALEKKPRVFLHPLVRRYMIILLEHYRMWSSERAFIVYLLDQAGKAHARQCLTHRPSQTFRVGNFIPAGAASP